MLQHWLACMRSQKYMKETQHQVFILQQLQLHWLRSQLHLKRGWVLPKFLFSRKNTN